MTATVATLTRAGHVESVTRTATGAETYTFVVATGGRKRDGFSLRPDGWRLDTYHRNGGPVLWQHDHARPPIGRAKAYRAGNALKADITFDQEDPFATLVENKVKNGFLRQTSVGWDFVDPASGEVISHHRVSRDFLERSATYDLNEISVVAVGADPDAVLELTRAARSRVIDLGSRPGRARTVDSAAARSLLTALSPQFIAERAIADYEQAVRLRRLAKGLPPLPGWPS